MYIIGVHYDSRTIKFSGRKNIYVTFRTGSNPIKQQSKLVQNSLTVSCLNLGHNKIVA